VKKSQLGLIPMLNQRLRGVFDTALQSTRSVGFVPMLDSQSLI
jgi:hypothetical protein